MYHYNQFGLTFNQWTLRTRVFWSGFSVFLFKIADMTTAQEELTNNKHIFRI